MQTSRCKIRFFVGPLLRWEPLAKRSRRPFGPFFATGCRSRHPPRQALPSDEDARPPWTGRVIPPGFTTSKSRSVNMQDLSELIESARQDFAQAEQPAALEDAKAKYIGKSGAVTALMKSLGQLAPEVRKSTRPRPLSKPRSTPAANSSLRPPCRPSSPAKRST